MKTAAIALALMGLFVIPPGGADIARDVDENQYYQTVRLGVAVLHVFQTGEVWQETNNCKWVGINRETLEREDVWLSSNSYNAYFYPSEGDEGTPNTDADGNPVMRCPKDTKLAESPQPILLPSELDLPN